MMKTPTLSPELQACLNACQQCLVACEHCAAACLAEPDVQMMVGCIRLDRDCAAACRKLAT
jgi:Domain of Unknown Function (DUF326)